MNRETDFNRFIVELRAVYELYGRTLSDAALAIFFRELEKYHVELVLKAISMHLRDKERGQYQPKPADIIYQIEGPEPTPMQIALEAQNPTTPLGVVAHHVIGSFDVKNSSSDKLERLAKAAVPKIKEAKASYIAGKASESLLEAFKRHGVGVGTRWSKTSIESPSGENLIIRDSRN